MAPETTIALTAGTMGIDMTTTSLATIALIAGTATMTVQITGAAGTTAGTTTTIDEYGGCRAAVFAPAALPSHRPSLLINPGLLG